MTAVPQPCCTQTGCCCAPAAPPSQLSHQANRSEPVHLCTGICQAGLTPPGHPCSTLSLSLLQRDLHSTAFTEREHRGGRSASQLEPQQDPFSSLQQPCHAALGVCALPSLEACSTVHFHPEGDCFPWLPLERPYLQRTTKEQTPPNLSSSVLLSRQRECSRSPPTGPTEMPSVGRGSVLHHTKDPD